MALQGTLDTFPLPDVLLLLVGTSKSGRLAVTGAAGGGTLWVAGPAIIGAECAGLSDPVEVLVTLLRLTDGDFRFDVDEQPAVRGIEVPIDEALAVATAYIAEWASVEAVLPSPDDLVSLREVLPAAEITVSATAWAGIVAIGGGGPVRDVLTRFGDVELDAARQIATLVEAGYVEVRAVPGAGSWLAPASARPAAPPAATPAPVDEPVVEVVTPSPPAREPVLDAAAPAPAARPTTSVGGPEDGAEMGTGQPWRDQVRQLLESAQAGGPGRVERFGPAAADAGPEPASAPSPPPAPAPDDGDRDVLLRFLGSVQQ